KILRDRRLGSGSTVKLAASARARSSKRSILRSSSRSGFSAAGPRRFQGGRSRGGLGALQAGPGAATRAGLSGASTAAEDRQTQQTPASHELPLHRDSQLGSDARSVSALTAVAPSEAKTLHQRPAVMQELEWRPHFSLGSVTPTQTHPVQQITFSFYDNQLS